MDTLEDALARSLAGELTMLKGRSGGITTHQIASPGSRTQLLARNDAVRSPSLLDGFGRRLAEDSDGASTVGRNPGRHPGNARKIGE